MANYFRITAYHPDKNICAVFDSNGRFEKLWQFSAYLVQKGFRIAEVGTDGQFHAGNLTKASASEKLIVRACAKGKPKKGSRAVTVSGKYYTPLG